jgi:hypothetical protein
VCSLPVRASWGTASHSIRYDNCFVRQEDCVGGIAALASIDITGFALGFAAIYLGIGEAPLSTSWSM